MTVVVPAPDAGGPPWGSVREEIAAVGGVEQEFFVSGEATKFALIGPVPTDYALDGRWVVEPEAQRPFRTRFLVLRPGDRAASNGTVVVLWNNVSGPETVVAGPQATRLLQDGFTLVGVSAQRVGIAGSAGSETGEAVDAPVFGWPGLRNHDPQRYGDLQHPGDAFSFDIFTQVSQLVGPRRPRGADPLDGLDVQRVVAMGGSQSASRLATYINAVQPTSQAFDAFLLLIYPGTPCALDRASAPPTLPEVPGANVFDLLPWHTHRLRDDTPVPVIVLNSEFEAEQCHPNHQTDSELMRWWEVAGTAHGGLMPRDQIAMLETMLPDACLVSFSAASRAALHALHRWLELGEPPPHHGRLEKTGQPPALARDEHGNATGGIRWPEVEAPLATHVGASPAGGALQLMGRTTPFAPERIRALYGDRDAWFARYRSAVDRLVADGVVLAEDGYDLIDLAAKVPIAAFDGDG